MGEPNVWVDPLGLAQFNTKFLKLKMQPYRYSDVLIKGPHADLFYKNRKVGEIFYDKNGEPTLNHFKGKNKDKKCVERWLDRQSTPNEVSDQFDRLKNDIQSELKGGGLSKSRTEELERAVQKFFK